MKKLITYITIASIFTFSLFIFVSADDAYSNQDVVYMVGEVLEEGTQTPVKGLVVNKYDSEASLKTDSPSFTCETYPKFYIQHRLTSEKAIAGKRLENTFLFTETYLKIYDPAFGEYLPKLVTLDNIEKPMNGDTVLIGPIFIQKQPIKK